MRWRSWTSTTIQLIQVLSMSRIFKYTNYCIVICDDANCCIFHCSPGRNVRNTIIFQRSCARRPYLNCNKSNFKFSLYLSSSPESLSVMTYECGSIMFTYNTKTHNIKYGVNIYYSNKGIQQCHKAFRFRQFLLFNQKHFLIYIIITNISYHAKLEILEWQVLGWPLFDHLFSWLNETCKHIHTIHQTLV